MFSSGSSTDSLARDPNLDRGISYSHSYFLRGRSDDSLMMKSIPRTITVDRQSRGTSRRGVSDALNFSEGISFYSLDKHLRKNSSLELMDIKPTRSIDEVARFMTGLRLSGEDLVRSRKNLTKNWLHRVKQIILEGDELLNFHDNRHEVELLRLQVERCGNRVNEIGQLFLNRRWLARFFEQEVFLSGAFTREVLSNPKLTDIGKYMLFESLPAFQFGMNNPERFTSWNLEKMSSNDEILDVAASEPFSYAMAMELLKKNDDSHEASPKNTKNKRKEGSENLTRYWVIAIKHLLESEATEIIRANGLSIYKNCLRLLKKCCSIAKFKVVLERNLWLRKYLLRDEASHLLRTILNDKKINKKSKRRLMETFPTLTAGVENPNRFSKWAEDN